MTEIALSEFAEHHWPDMVRFYREFYGPGYIFTRREFFNWNFFSPLRPDGRCGQRLMLDGDKIIGIMGLLPWPLQANGRQDIGEYNINLYLDPAYRGHRMGQRLLESVAAGYSYSISNGFNERTLSMYKRLGKVYHWKMFRFIKCLDVERLEGLIREAPGFSELDDEIKRQAIDDIRESAAASTDIPSLTFERVERFGGEWDAAWDGIRKAYGFTTWRNARFLNWRYIDYPFPLYKCYLARRGTQIIGLVVLRVESPSFGAVLRIVDLVCAGEAQSEVLAFTERLAREHNAVFLDFIFQGAMSLRPLEENGYRELRDHASGAQLLPMDLNPVRYRDDIPILITFLNREDPACAEVERGSFYLVKGDGDQDRAN